MGFFVGFGWLVVFVCIGLGFCLFVFSLLISENTATISTVLLKKKSITWGDTLPFWHTPTHSGLKVLESHPIQALLWSQRSMYPFLPARKTDTSALKTAFVNKHLAFFILPAVQTELCSQNCVNRSQTQNEQCCQIADHHKKLRPGCIYTGKLKYTWRIIL